MAMLNNQKVSRLIIINPFPLMASIIIEHTDTHRNNALVGDLHISGTIE